ncbi:MAG: hypothetical protein AAFQ35_13225, partial [Pseudomonadota bacterium]
QWKKLSPCTACVSPFALLVTVAISNGLTHAVHGESFFHWQLSTRVVPARGTAPGNHPTDDGAQLHDAAQDG